MITWILVALWLWAIYRCLFGCPGDDDPYMDRIIEAVEGELGHSLDELSVGQRKAAQ